MTATCRTASGIRDQGSISDISATGCCLATKSTLVKVGGRVVIRPEGMEGLGATVRWISGNRMGVEFDSPLYQPVVDHLTTRYAKDGMLSVSY